MATCPKCGEEKPLDDFYKNRSTKNGHTNRCKSCITIDRRLHYESLPPLEVDDPVAPCVRCNINPRMTHRKRLHAWCLSCQSEIEKERRAANPSHYEVKDRSKHLRTKYNLSISDYDAMEQEQGGLCALCHRPEMTTESGKAKRRLSVDHDHHTGAVRALLCITCNIGLGSFMDDPELLDAAASYLRHHRAIANQLESVEPRQR